MAKPLRALVVSVQVPYTRGGAEVLVNGLMRELSARGFAVDLIQFPFCGARGELAREAAVWRSIHLDKIGAGSPDFVICTKFPSYLVQHPRKSLWLVHQHRQIYELYGTNFSDFSPVAEDETLRQHLMDLDRMALKECRPRFGISPTVAQRAERYLNIDVGVLTPPLPLGNRYHSGVRGDYILSVGRLCRIKRVELMIEALPNIDTRLRLKIVGSPDEPGIMEYYKNLITKHHLENRVEFLGRVGDDDLISLYAGAFGIFYAPYDEDYGYVTLEALASSKPVVAATDSGGVLGFIKHSENGMVADPTPSSIAHAFDTLFRDEELYENISKRCARSFSVCSWGDVVGELTDFPENPDANSRSAGGT